MFKPINIALLLLIAFSFFLYLWGIDWGLPSFEGWAPDELVPSKILKGIEVKFSNGWFDKYPPFHYYVLTLIYSPFLLLQNLNLLNFEALSDYALLFYAGRFFSVIMACGIVFLVYLCGREIYDYKRAILAAAIAAFICPLFYYAKMANLEVPYTFWLILSLFFYLRILKSHQLKDYTGFTIAAVFSICTKDQAYGFYVLTPFFIIYHHYLSRKKTEKEAKLIDSFRDKKVTFSFFLGLALFLGLHNLFFNLQGFAAHVKYIVAGGARARPQFEMTIPGELQMLWHSILVQTRFSFGWPMYLICMLGLGSTLLNNKSARLLVYLGIPAVSYYLFYVALMGSNDVRFLLPIFIILAWFGGKILGDFLERDRRFYRAKVAAIVALFAYTVLYSSSLNLLMTQDSRYSVEQWMRQNIAEGSLVLGVGNAKYLPREQNFNFTNLRRPSVNELLQLNPDYAIVSSAYDARRFKKNSPEYEFFSKLDSGKVGYEVVWSYRSQARGNLIDDKELFYRDGRQKYIYSNFDKINPKITIFRKISRVTKKIDL